MKGDLSKAVTLNLSCDEDPAGKEMMGWGGSLWAFWDSESSVTAEQSGRPGQPEEALWTRAKNSGPVRMD